MRQYIIASHAHFATGIKESIELLSGARDNVHDLSMFVDDRMDVAEEAQKLLAGMAADDDVVVCTDLFGGTPSNVAAAIGNQTGVRVFCGLNAPMLLEACVELQNDGKLDYDAILSAGKAACKDVVAEVKANMAEGR